MKTSKEIARIFNEKSANLKDWRLNDEGKHLREIAREALESDCLIGTVAEINSRYPGLIESDRVADHEPGESFAWAIVPSVGSGRKRLSIACIGLTNE